MVLGEGSRDESSWPVVAAKLCHDLDQGGDWRCCGLTGHVSKVQALSIWEEFRRNVVYLLLNLIAITESATFGGYCAKIRQIRACVGLKSELNTLMT